MTTLFNPNTLFLLATLLALVPIYAGAEVLRFYPGFAYTGLVPSIYLGGLASFWTGGVLVSLFPRRRAPFRSNWIDLPRGHAALKIAFAITLASNIALLLVRIQIYRGIPALELFQGGKYSVNAIQASAGDGIFGVALLLMFPLLWMTPWYVKQTWKRSPVRAVLYLMFLLVLFTFDGKRQLLFLSITYAFAVAACGWQSIPEREKRATTRAFVVALLLALFVFTILGVVRYSASGFNVRSAVYPIVSYLTYPYINMSSIASSGPLQSHGLGWKIYAFLFNQAPALFRPNLSIGMPLLEPTSPPTLYGLTYWIFGAAGCVILPFLLGVWLNILYFYAKTRPDPYYSALYAMSCWPSLSIHTYDLFFSWMLYIIPVGLLIATRHLSSLLYLFPGRAVATEGSDGTNNV